MVCRSIFDKTWHDRCVKWCDIKDDARRSEAEGNTAPGDTEPQNHTRDVHP